MQEIRIPGTREYTIYIILGSKKKQINTEMRDGVRTV